MWHYHPWERTGGHVFFPRWPTMSYFLFVGAPRATFTAVEDAFGAEIVVSDATGTPIGEAVTGGRPEWTAFHIRTMNNADATALIGKGGRLKHGRLVRTRKGDRRELLWAGCRRLIESSGSVSLLAPWMHGHWNHERLKVARVVPVPPERLALPGFRVSDDVLYVVAPK